MKVLAVHIVTSLLILLFTYTAINKLIEGKIFYLFLKQVPLLKNGAGVIRFLLPLTELVIVLLLLFKRTRLSGLFWSMVLMGCFIIYLGYMMVFVPELPCSCGGVISEMGWGEHLVFNVGVMGGAFWGWREGGPSFAPPSLRFGGRSRDDRGRGMTVQGEVASSSR